MRRDFRPQDFIQEMSFDGDLEGLVGILKPMKPRCVLTGSEAGVELADALCERLGLPFNGKKTSERCRNKYLMVEAVRSAGLHAADQLKTSSLEEIYNWKSEKGYEQIVLKPLRSSGSEDVSLCRSQQQVREAFQSITCHRNKYGDLNSEVLVQSFLKGKEYFVDTVSLNGTHYISEIIAYDKGPANGRDFIYFSSTVLPYEGELQASLITYSKKVLEALGIRHGPAHIEIIMTDQGPALVECGARFAGGHTPDLMKPLTGVGQIVAVADIVTDPKKFLSYADKPFVLKKSGIYLFLVCPSYGQTFSEAAIESLKDLESYQVMYLSREPGELLEFTIDISSEAGAVFLSHEDPEALQRDVNLLRDIEKKALYIPFHSRQSNLQFA